MTVSNTIYSAFSFVGFLFCAIPFTWHLKNGNTGVSLLTAWLGVFCLSEFINSVVWNNNVVNWSPVWCDICTRIYIGSSVGLPASTLCVFRRLYSISSAPGTMPVADRSLKRRQVMIDLAIGLGLPFLVIIFAYIAGGHRFNILEDIGCTPAIHPSPVSVALLNIPPILISLVTACYALLTLRAFNRRRILSNEIFAQHNNLTSGFYVRLMFFASFELLWTTPVATFFLYAAVKGGVEPWTGWADVHFNFSRVLFAPRSVWESDILIRSTIELGRWLGVIGAFSFFAFFGFAEEARRNYRAVYLEVAKYIGHPAASSELAGDPRPMSKKNNVEALVFAHTTVTSISISMPIPDIEAHNSDEIKGGQNPIPSTTPELIHK